MARWTPEGGAPITPETSTWTPSVRAEAVLWVEEHTGQQLDTWQKTVVAQLSVAGEVGEAATQSPTRRSWFSRLWRWMWLRG
jgi:hypothetical protein